MKIFKLCAALAVTVALGLPLDSGAVIHFHSDVPWTILQSSGTGHAVNVNSSLTGGRQKVSWHCDGSEGACFTVSNGGRDVDLNSITISGSTINENDDGYMYSDGNVTIS